MRGGAVDDLELDAEMTGRGLGTGAGVGGPVHGDDGGAAPGGLGREGAAAAADVPHEVAGTGSEPGELGRAQQFGLALAEVTAVRLGG